jgi:hypothetical protein
LASRASAVAPMSCLLRLLPKKSRFHLSSLFGSCGDVESGRRCR